MQISFHKRRAMAAGGVSALIALGGIAAGLVGASRTAQARQAAPTLSIFGGAPAQSSGLTLSSWGSGSITEDQKSVYSGSESLRIVTHGQFQGASMRLGRPVNLGSFVADKGAYLQLAVLMPAMGTTSGGGGGMMGGSSGPMGPPGGFGGRPGGFGMPGGMPGSSGPGGKMGGAPASSQGGRAIDNLRLVLLRPGGKGTEVVLPVASGAVDNAWRLLSIPVGAIPGITADNATFSEIRLFGDNPGVIYVGRIGVVVDNSPIKVEPVNDMIVGVRSSYRYVASANAGPTPLRYSWDWDNADGVQEESVGRSVAHTYYKEGDFVGSLTVSDAYGFKAPVTTKFKVHVHL